MQSIKTIVTAQRIFYAIAIVLSHVELSSAAVNCGGVLRGETGTFTSPNYPFPQSSIDPNSKKLIECVWEIIVPEGYGIHLNFGDFRMAAGPDQCEKGMISVYKGVGEGKQFQDKYCGTDEINIINLKVNSATVTFQRPENFEGIGFLISYIATQPPNHVNDFVTCVDKGKKHVGVEEFSVICPGGCANLTDMDSMGSNNQYRDDSHLCKAAVHAGVISDKHGGRIYVERKSGLEVYAAEFANGILSKGAAMSDVLFSFSNFGECNSPFDVTKDQLSASSAWEEKDKNEVNKTYIWSSDGALKDALSAWSPDDPTTEQWLQIDLKQRKNITGIITDGSKTRKYFTTRSYEIQYSDDAKTWTKYKEEGIDSAKVFIGNQQYFETSRNNFIRPSIIARYLRVYPTPTKPKGRGGYTRYAIKISLLGCDLLTSSVANPTPNVPTLSSTTPQAPVVTDKPVNTLNETSIIVIGIVAALAVTSILLASCVLILVRKRKKNMKTVKGNGPADRMHLNNNNLAGQYLNGFERKKSKTRKPKTQPTPNPNEAIEIQNISYKDTIINAGFGATPTTTLLQGHHSVNGGFLNGNGIPKHEDMDSYASDGDHEYQIIPDEHIAPSSVHSHRTGSSKHSTGSSVQSRKSDTMQRVWNDPRAPVTQSPVFDTNTPTFPLHHSFSQPPMSTFVPRLPKSNPPRRTHSQSPHHMSSSSNEYAPDNNFPRKHSLGSRPFYSTNNGDPNNYGNGQPPLSSYQYPNPNAPPPLLHHTDVGANNDHNQQKSRSEAIRAAKQRQGYDRLYRNNSSPNGDKYYPPPVQPSLQRSREEDECMNSYDKLDLP